MKNVIEIASKPFYFRPLEESDLEEIHALWLNEKVRQYLFDNIEIPVEQAAEEIRSSTASFEKNGYGLWAVCFKDQSEMIGFTGYRSFFDPPELQLLYGLLPEYFGHGYATVFAKVMIKYGFEELQFDEIIACADAPNKASFQVMEKAGMNYEKRVLVDGMDTVYYKLRRDEYQPLKLDFEFTS